MIDTHETCDLMTALSLLADAPQLFPDYLRCLEEPESLSDYLHYHRELHQKKLSRVVAESAVIRSYAYDIFSGKKAHPDKYKLIPICIVLQMNAAEINRALLLAGQAPLSPKLPRDAGIILCIDRGMHSIPEINEFLYDCHLETFE